MEYQKLMRSTKRCVAFSVLAYGSRLTYLGASTYELSNDFVKNNVKASDVIIFGSYGPNYKFHYKYNLTSVDYLVFHDDSRDYLINKIDENKVVEPNKKFIFKVSRKND